MLIFTCRKEPFSSRRVTLAVKYLPASIRRAATEPYTYCELLHDESKKKAHREELQAEHDEYEAYLAELKKTLEEMLNEGNIRLLWNVN